MKNKSAIATKDAIQYLMENEIGQKPEVWYVDNGREFRNHIVEQYLMEQGIKIASPQVLSITKCAFVERFQRSLEDLLHRYFTAKQTTKYVDQLSAMMKVYNNRGHRSLDYYTPEQAEKEEYQGEIYNIISQRYYDLAKKRKKPKYEVGTDVYVHRPKEAFVRGYQERYYKERFIISKVLTRMPIPMYEVKRKDNDQVFPRSLYEEELQPCPKKDDVYKIEKVIKERTLADGKTKEYLVKWLGWGDEHNSWVGQDQIVEVYDN